MAYEPRSVYEYGDEAPRPAMTGPIPLGVTQEQAVKDWAADDRLWTTQETVECNLRTFARLVLKLESKA